MGADAGAVSESASETGAGAVAESVRVTGAAAEGAASADQVAVGAPGASDYVYVADV